MVDEKLLSILVCPEDRGPLLLVDGEFLYNPRLRRAYRIEDGIPVPVSYTHLTLPTIYSV